MIFVNQMNLHTNIPPLLRIRAIGLKKKEEEDLLSIEMVFC